MLHRFAPLIIYGTYVTNKKFESIRLYYFVMQQKSGKWINYIKDLKTMDFA